MKQGLTLEVEGGDFRKWVLEEAELRLKARPYPCQALLTMAPLKPPEEDGALLCPQINTTVVKGSAHRIVLKLRMKNKTKQCNRRDQSLCLYKKLKFKVKSGDTCGR